MTVEHNVTYQSTDTGRMSQVTPSKAETVDRKSHRLLFLGPAGGHVGGGPSLFHAFRHVLEEYAGLELDIIDTAPPSTYAAAQRDRSNLVNNETVKRTLRLLRQFQTRIRQSDSALVFSNNDFAFALIPLMALMAKTAGTPIYLKTIGGDLDLAISELKGPTRSYVMRALRSLNGILAETVLLKQALERLGCENVYYIPNCRQGLSLDTGPRASAQSKGTLRLVFISQVHQWKGVFVLLDALRHVEEQGSVEVHCDFYGPLFDDAREEFTSRVNKLPRVAYKGVLPPGQAPIMMQHYDALVLPTFYVHEGHPGIIIEAMQAGIPVLSTEHRAIPELIKNGVNGILVPPRDSEALANSIVYLAENPADVVRMGNANADVAQDFSAEHVVQRALEIVLPEASTAGSKPATVPEEE